MGWGNCGEDAEGRNIGYIYNAICDHVTCDKEIDRGLYYVCGRMHGEDENSCEKYFCDEHRNNPVDISHDDTLWVCDDCAKFHLNP